jgi:hypothetical protein
MSFADFLRDRQLGPGGLEDYLSSAVRVSLVEGEEGIKLKLHSEMYNNVVRFLGRPTVSCV